MESLAAAVEIVRLGQEAKEAVVGGRRDLALALISEVQLAAKDIVLALRMCKRGGAA